MKEDTNTSKRPFSFHSTVLFVKDVEKSKKFYTEVMGEKISLDLGINIGFESGLALWDGNYGRNVIFKKNFDEDFSTKKSLELYYETEDMKETVAVLKLSGTKFVHDAIEQPWCQLTVRFLDPDGHMIEVGERMDVCVKRLEKGGKSSEEIAKMTTMPMEIIKEILKN
ncbi:catechol 2,3-dioxygenase-like lactoylglutathione lyase family enzyme [Methanomicrobium sp. W14]|uniref:VOC family protein n=1 Tax=Methanomicrobium sp. W14 TaxID=2817839 RepID=UPI001AE43C18|nr:VOC family protein [Methanomicrobium sp. W14]MBP2133246.1 catechol 2,3-dioxygenase-like lactoylglutathione lyase family enzyme [Methanomicrobium sp. W14]